MSDRSQLQTGNPAFGAGFQGGDISIGKIQSHYLVEKFSGFGGGKLQVSGAQARSVGPERAAGPGAKVGLHGWR